MKQKLFESITDEQIRKIHARSKEICISEEDLYSMISNIIRIPIMTAMSRQEAGFLIEQLEWDRRYSRPAPAVDATAITGNADRLPFLSHVSGIRSIVKDLGWDKQHLKNWLKKYMKVNSIRDLDRVRARDAFVALKKQIDKKAISQKAGDP